MLFLVSSLAGGALSGSLIWHNRSSSIAIIIVALLFSVIAIFLSVKFKTSKIFAACLIAFLVGFILADQASNRAADVSVQMDVVCKCEGVVRDSPAVRQWGGQADVKLTRCALPSDETTSVARGMARLYLDRDDIDLMPGARIKFRARFYAPREYRNPGGFSYRQYLIVHGVGVQGKVLGRVERMGEGNRFLSRIELIRRQIAKSAAGNVAEPARGVVVALANGDQAGVDQELRDVFANTGLAHLLAISGMNVGYIALFIYFVARFLFGFFPKLLLRIPLKHLAAMATIPSIWLYVLLTGSAISAIRAAIMLTVYLAGLLIWRRQDLLTTLANSVVIILIIMPLSVLDVSFQLSVVAVAGIVIVAPALTMMMSKDADLSSRQGRVTRWCAALLAVSAAATLATAPLVAYHFKFISSIGVLANLIAVPLTGALLSPVVAVASGIAIIAPAYAWPLWKISGWAAALFIDFARFVADIGGPTLIRWAPSCLEVLLAYSAMASIILWNRLRYKWAVVAALSLTIIADAGYWRLLPYFNKGLEIMILDVGQGDSSLVRFPGGKTLLIDGGGVAGSSLDIGRNVVAPALWRMGIHRLDWIILTHPHYDHYRGLGFIASNFDPTLIWTNGLEAPDDEAGEWRAFTKAIEMAGVPIVPVKEGGHFEDVDGASLGIIKPQVKMNDDLNDSSLVVDIRHGTNRFLFMGDLSEPGERRLIDTAGDLGASFIRIAHHGSADASSPAFLGAVRPKIAAISVGERNRYGMPDSKVLNRLESVGASVYRTDKDGAITIKDDGDGMKIGTFVGRH